MLAIVDLSPCSRVFGVGKKWVKNREVFAIEWTMSPSLGGRWVVFELEWLS